MRWGRSRHAETTRAPPRASIGRSPTSTPRGRSRGDNATTATLPVSLISVNGTSSASSGLHSLHSASRLSPPKVSSRPKGGVQPWGRPRILAPRETPRREADVPRAVEHAFQGGAGGAVAFQSDARLLRPQTAFRYQVVMTWKTAVEHCVDALLRKPATITGLQLAVVRRRAGHLRKTDFVTEVASDRSAGAQEGARHPARPLGQTKDMAGHAEQRSAAPEQERDHPERWHRGRRGHRRGQRRSPSAMARAHSNPCQAPVQPGSPRQPSADAGGTGFRRSPAGSRTS